MHARGVELISQVRTAGAGAQLVIGPEHDVVREQLRTPVEQLGECLLPVLGVELVLLLDRNPGQLPALLGHPPAELRVLGLELCKLIASRLPFLAGSYFVPRHRAASSCVSSVVRYPVSPVKHIGRAASGVQGKSNSKVCIERSCTHLTNTRHISCVRARCNGSRYGLSRSRWPRAGGQRAGSERSSSARRGASRP